MRRVTRTSTRAVAVAVLFCLVLFSGLSVCCVQDLETEPVEEPAEEPTQELPPDLPGPIPEPITEQSPVDEPVVVEEPEEEETEEMEKQVVEVEKPAVLAPVAVYPAYVVTDYGSIFGIPASLQGAMQREPVQITDVDGNTPHGKISVYTVRGILYVVREWADNTGVEHTDYYAQDLSADGVPKIELVESAPKMPEQERVQFDSPEWLIKSVVLSGIEFSYLYNRHDSVWGGAGDGEWVGRKQKITGFVVLENGLMVVSEDGAQFCPSNRKGLYPVVEDSCVLWR